MRRDNVNSIIKTRADDRQRRREKSMDGWMDGQERERKGQMDGERQTQRERDGWIDTDGQTEK